MNIKALWQRYPLATYFFLAFLISWGGSFAVAGPKFLRGETLQLADGLRMFPLVLAGPTVAGIVATYIVTGAEGLRALFSRVIRWRVNLRWYAAALLIFPVGILAVLLGLATLVSPDFAPNFISFGIIAGLLAGFFEELGWMGFAYPRLQSKYGVLPACFILGLLHGIWHFAPGYLSESKTLGFYWWPRFIVMWIVAMTAMRILLVWIYANTQSVLLAQLTHASSSGFLVILGPSAISSANEIFWWAIYAVVLWLAVAVVLTKYGKYLIGTPKQPKAGWVATH